MPRDQLPIDLADDGHIPDLVGKWQGNGIEALIAGQLGRVAAALEPGLAQEGGETGSQEIEGHAGNGLVALEIDRGQAVNTREHQGCADAGQQAKPGRTGDGGHGCRREGAGEQLALEADIDNAGPLGIEAGQRRQDQRYGKAHGGVENEGQVDQELLHHLPPAAGSGWAKSRESGPRSMSPMAPVNRITRAWMVTIISRVMPGIWKASS